jgi:aminopeptidase N
MRWFDDLWLKEGFAEYMAFQTLASLKPDDNVWKRFYEVLKPSAYAIDVTKGTTPIYQEIPNLKDAKSAYGAIVYDKAPGILKQLAFVLEPAPFRDGLRLYLKEHLYGNAEWSDLVGAFERTSGRTLNDWANLWIKHRGMPQVDVHWSCDSGRVNSFLLTQHDVLGEGGVWPIATQVLMSYGDSNPVRLRAEFDTAGSTLPDAIGKPCPQYVFANDEDYAYGRFLLDQNSQQVAIDNLASVNDIFLRTVLWGALWESVRVADLAPRDYINLSERLLPAQTDESLTQTVLLRTTQALHRYVAPTTRLKFLPSFENMAANLMLHSSGQGLRIIWFRGLRGVAETAEGRATLKALLSEKISVPGVELRQLDRWNMVTALIALNDSDGDTVFRAEQKRDHTGDGLKYGYVAEAARPDAAVKQQYFKDYLQNPARPEDWIQQSLGAFNYWKQSELTEPFLKPALEALPQIKRERKIFFLLAWLNAFITGQQSTSAQAEVYKFLGTSDLDKDVRLKILQVVDELDRTVRIRQKFAE